MSRSFILDVGDIQDETIVGHGDHRGRRYGGSEHLLVAFAEGDSVVPSMVQGIPGQNNNSIRGSWRSNWLSYLAW